MSREERLLALVPPALVEADRAVARRLLQDRDRGLALACRKGCAACCHYLVRVSIAEVLHIRRVVEALSEEHRERVRSRAAVIRSEADQADLTADLEGGLILTPGDPGQEARMESLSRRYLALDVACPFLDDGACSIYEDRPTPCRQHGVTSGADLCVDPFSNNVRAVAVWPLVRDRLVWECAQITGEPPRMLPLAFRP